MESASTVQVAVLGANVLNVVVGVGVDYCTPAVRGPVSVKTPRRYPFEPRQAGLTVLSGPVGSLLPKVPIQKVPLTQLARPGQISAWQSPLRSVDLNTLFNFNDHWLVYLCIHSLTAQCLTSTTQAAFSSETRTKAWQDRVCDRMGLCLPGTCAVSNGEKRVRKLYHHQRHLQQIQVI